MNTLCISKAVKYWGDFFTELRSDKIDGFKKDLIEFLEEELNEGNTVILTTDWAPENILRNFLQKNDLPEKYFPKEAVMYIKTNEVTARESGKEVLRYPN
ncbi:MAG: hypothetical protein WC011_00780 [Candidatus Paceibacterota bacterium]